LLVWQKLFLRSWHSMMLNLSLSLKGITCI